MLDYTLIKGGCKNFILNYYIFNGNIIVNYADKSIETVPYSIEIEKEIKIDIVILIDIEMDIARCPRAGLREKRNFSFFGSAMGGAPFPWGAPEPVRAMRPHFLWGAPKENRGAP